MTTCRASVAPDEVHDHVRGVLTPWCPLQRPLHVLVLQEEQARVLPAMGEPVSGRLGVAIPVAIGEVEKQARGTGDEVDGIDGFQWGICVAASRSWGAS